MDETDSVASSFGLCSGLRQEERILKTVWNVRAVEGAEEGAFVWRWG
jgi:hypothetical protein